MGWNAIVNCIDDGGNLHTKGKCYSVKDGKIEYDGGVYDGCSYRNIDELNENMASQFEFECNVTPSILLNKVEPKSLIDQRKCELIEKSCYWDNICKMQQKQTDKGINKYGQILEENIKMSPEERITYLQEELIDGLMYCEHIKQNNYNGLTPNDYQKAALRTASNQSKENLILNGALGLSGETGEVSDHIKKNLFQGHALDKDYLAKELGDICWYIAILSEGIGYELSEVMQMNIDKLKKRYPNGFEVEKSLHREIES